METWGNFPLSIRSTLTLFVKIVMWKNRHVRHRYWSWIFGGNPMVQRTENPQTSPSTFKWSEGVGPGSSNLLPTAVLESLTCGDDPEYHSDVCLLYTSDAADDLLCVDL